MSENVSQTVITPTARLSFANLVEARAYQENGKAKGEPKYSTELIFEPEDLTNFKVPDEDTGQFVDVDVRQLAVRLAKQKWPGLSIKEAVNAGALQWLVVDGDELAAKFEARGKKSEHYAGKKVLKVNSGAEYPPKLYTTVNGKRKQIVRGLDSDETLAKQHFASGNYAFAELNIVAADGPRGKYVKGYVNSVRFVKKGDPLGSGSLMDRFEGVHGGVSAHDPTAGMGETADASADLDDDIPF